MFKTTFPLEKKYFTILFSDIKEDTNFEEQKRPKNDRDVSNSSF